LLGYVKLIDVGNANWTAANNMCMCCILPLLTCNFYAFFNTVSKNNMDFLGA